MTTPMSKLDHRLVRAADVFKHVSHPARLQILVTLACGERNVSELCDDLGAQGQPAVSHHLALLRHGGLIEPRRDGKLVYYRLSETGRELARLADLIAGGNP